MVRSDGQAGGGDKGCVDMSVIKFDKNAATRTMIHGYFSMIGHLCDHLLGLEVKDRQWR